MTVIHSLKPLQASDKSPAFHMVSRPIHPRTPLGDFPGPTTHSEYQTIMMTKDQLVESIIGLNPTAAVEYLMSFDVPDLRRYLDRLLFEREPRGRESRWIREGDTPAILSH